LTEWRASSSTVGQARNHDREPLHAVKLYHDIMWKAKELKLRKAELK
jgi:hypothetical protein